MQKYYPRIADALLQDKLSYMGAVLVRGAKWCGKTTTCEQLAKSALYMGDPDNSIKNLAIAKLRPSTLLKGDMPRLLDEWQVAPELWDAVRYAIDHGTTGMFLLTGSAVPPQVDENDDRCVLLHSGTGRIARFTMRPMSLFESGESSGEVSLNDLRHGIDPTGASNKQTLETIAEIICRGGWPSAINLQQRSMTGPSHEYVEAIVESDISRVDGTLRNPARVRLLLRSLSRLQGTQSSANVICEDMRENDSSSLNDDTVYKYLSALQKIFVIEDMPAWCPNLRCKTPIRTANTRYFTDPSIATAALGIGAGNLMDDLSSFGLLFETLTIRDLRIYAEAQGAHISHYHDKSGLECDAIIHWDNGEYGLIEIKLGGEVLIEKGVSTLNTLNKKLAIAKDPVFKMILVADGNFAYRRKDNIIICPLGCLRP